ncbi:MAG: GNAT family N-acetyltransferase [Bacteroidota bacterium]|nr:GNAT family N-acetyltransferase [Bacteroidota bacterium]MDX5426530.1 GNAT family N-acetyltransferase [Bacteroidota bacterium]MDX5449199.1 GNAT family N-acetyltransferase [Bacteroidota bacterium]
MYIFHRLNPDRYSDLQGLFKKAFGSVHSLDWIEKKYNTDFLKVRDIGIIAYSEKGEAAAYYGVFPMRARYEGKSIIVGQSGDTMTAPEHQKKGLFTQLAQKCYSLSSDQGLSLIFGFPNKNSFPGFQRKLNWEFTGAMTTYQIKGHRIPMLEIAYKFPILRGPVHKRAHKILRLLSTFPSEELVRRFQLNQNSAGILHDQDFFAYKLRRPGIFLIQWEGFDLLVKIDSHLIIGDCGHFDTSRISEFVNALKRLGKKVGAGKVTMSLSPNHWLSQSLGNESVTSEGLPIGFFCIDPKIDPQGFVFCQADFDTF